MRKSNVIGIAELGRLKSHQLYMFNYQITNFKVILAGKFCHMDFHFLSFFNLFVIGFFRGFFVILVII